MPRGRRLGEKHTGKPDLTREQALKTMEDAWHYRDKAYYGFGTDARRKGFQKALLTHLIRLKVREAKKKGQPLTDVFVEGIGNLPKITKKDLVRAKLSSWIGPGEDQYKSVPALLEAHGFATSQKVAKIDKANFERALSHIESIKHEHRFFQDALKATSEEHDFAFSTLHALMNPNYSRFACKDESFKKRINALREHFKLAREEKEKEKQPEVSAFARSELNQALEILRHYSFYTTPEPRKSKGKDAKAKWLADNKTVKKAFEDAAFHGIAPKNDYETEEEAATRIVKEIEKKLGVEEPRIEEEPTPVESELREFTPNEEVRQLMLKKWAAYKKASKKEWASEKFKYAHTWDDPRDRVTAAIMLAEKLNKRISDLKASEVNRGLSSIYIGRWHSIPGMIEEVERVTGKKAEDVFIPKEQHWMDKYLDHLQTILDTGGIWSAVGREGTLQDAPMQKIAAHFGEDNDDVREDFVLMDKERQKRFFDILKQRDEKLKALELDEPVEETEEIPELPEEEPTIGEALKKAVDEKVAKPDLSPLEKHARFLQANYPISFKHLKTLLEYLSVVPSGELPTRAEILEGTNLREFQFGNARRRIEKCGFTIESLVGQEFPFLEEEPFVFELPERELTKEEIEELYIKIHKDAGLSTTSNMISRFANVKLYGPSKAAKIEDVKTRTITNWLTRELKKDPRLQGLYDWEGGKEEEPEDSDFDLEIVGEEPVVEAKPAEPKPISLEEANKLAEEVIKHITLKKGMSAAVLAREDLKGFLEFGSLNLKTALALHRDTENPLITMSGREFVLTDEGLFKKYNMTDREIGIFNAFMKKNVTRPFALRSAIYASRGDWAAAEIALKESGNPEPTDSQIVKRAKNIRDTFNSKVSRYPELAKYAPVKKRNIVSTEEEPDEEKDEPTSEEDETIDAEILPPEGEIVKEPEVTAIVPSKASSLGEAEEGEDVSAYIDVEAEIKRISPDRTDAIRKIVHKYKGETPLLMLEEVYNYLKDNKLVDESALSAVAFSLGKAFSIRTVSAISKEERELLKEMGKEEVSETERDTTKELSLNQIRDKLEPEAIQRARTIIDWELHMGRPVYEILATAADELLKSKK